MGSRFVATEPVCRIYRADRTAFMNKKAERIVSVDIGMNLLSFTFRHARSVWSLTWDRDFF